MIDINGPDNEAVDEVKALILESLKAWKNYKKRNARWSTAGVSRGSRSAQGTLNSRDLRMWSSCHFNDFIKDDFIPEGDGQVASGSAFLPEPLVLETEEHMLEREQNERDFLDALGEEQV